MRRLPPKILTAVACALAAFAVLCSVAVLTSDWAALSVGAIALVGVVLCVIAIRDLRQQRSMTKSLASQLESVGRRVTALEAQNRVVADRLEALVEPIATISVFAREVANRPTRLRSDQNARDAEMAARFDWIARRQSELLRAVRGGSAAAPDGASGVARPGAEVD